MHIIVMSSLYIIFVPQMRSTEEGLLDVDELVQTYKHSCSWFLGPFYHLVRLFHPDYVKPLLMAPGTMTAHQSN